MAKKKNADSEQVRTKIAIICLVFVAIVVALFFTRFKDYTEYAEEVEAGSGWITSCNYSHSLPDDPIVSPGRPGAAHMHDFFGSRVTNTNSTADSLLAGETTCAMPADKSAYWVPALFTDNERVLPTGTSKHILAYYRMPMSGADKSMQSLPKGLKMIIGNQHATAPEDNKGITDRQIQFKCGPGSGNDQPTPPSMCMSGIMVISYTFPSCWDGKNLDSTDHISHMSYGMGGGCPASHPVAVPRIKVFIRYPVGQGPIGNVSLSSGPYYTAHMDFFNGWEPAALDSLVQKCLVGGVDCGKNPGVSGTGGMTSGSSGMNMNRMNPTMGSMQ